MASPSHRASSSLEEALAVVLQRLGGDDPSSFDEGGLADELERLRGELAHGRPRGSVVERLHESIGIDTSDEVDLADASKPSSSPSSELIARLAAQAPLGSRYRITGEIARGGMGAILKAYDPDLRRLLAMKVALVADAEEDRCRLRERTVRFLEEAQITGQLDHPGIVPVHELGLDSNGRLYFTMRLVEGLDLSSVFQLARAGQQDWSTTRVLGVLLKVCEALSYAHSKGVVHRDLKPSNVMVGRFGEVYVMDWGLAKMLESEQHADVRAPGSEASSRHRLESVRRNEISDDPATPLVTKDGAILGTPAYMPPEQAAGEHGTVDARSDVYALGAMLYHLLAGHAPYRDGSGPGDVHALWERLLREPPRPLSEIAPATPPELVAIVARAMARDPSQRYGGAAELGLDLRAWLEGRVVRAYRTGPLVELEAWIKRNRAFAATILGALVVGVTASLGFAVTEARRSEKIAQLSDLYLVDRVIGGADLHEPPAADEVLRYERWLAEAEALLARLPAHTRELAEVGDVLGSSGIALAAGGVPAVRDDGASTEALWRFATLQELVAKLESLRSPDGGKIAAVRARLESARTLRTRTIESAEARSSWAEACASIADPAQCPRYAGLSIAPQYGLLPIGRDPESGLWEFAHLASGEAARRDERTGRLRIEASTGLVMVLLPGDPGGAEPVRRTWTRMPSPHGARALGRRRGPEAPQEAPSLVKEVLGGPRAPAAPFFLSKFELTQAQWSRLAGTNPSTTQPGLVPDALRERLEEPALHPVETVSAADGSTLLARFGLRLPSDVEWEFAALGGDEAPESDGGSRREHDSPLHAPVVRTPPNGFGLHGILGNVWEWCTVDTADPEIEELTEGYVICGGSFRSPSDSREPFFRSILRPERRQADTGLRPLLALEPASRHPQGGSR